MQIEISDPAYMDSLREYLQHEGCPSERRSEEVVEVLVLRPADAPPLSESDMRMKIFGHLREWCSDHPCVKANLLS
jgi:hypothetical protein